jgi:hypothetical protein
MLKMNPRLKLPLDSLCSTTAYPACAHCGVIFGELQIKAGVCGMHLLVCICCAGQCVVCIVLERELK